MTIGTILGLIVFAGLVLFACRHLHKCNSTAINDFQRKAFYGRRREIEDPDQDTDE